MAEKKILKQLEERLKYLQEMGVDFIAIPDGMSKISATLSAAPLASRKRLRTGKATPEIQEFGSATASAGEAVPDTRKGKRTIVSSEGAARGKERSLLLGELRAQIGDCTRCRLSAGRRHIVFGSGSPQAELMFIGEGPGADEDIQGLPFVGRAGQLLTKIINAIEMDREQVYIANIIKCRPPGNRNPLPDEIETCVPFLHKQIEIIKPKVIVALGSFAAQTILKTTLPITSLRGRFMKLGEIQVMPTFHTAFLLRNPNKKKEVWEDMKLVREALRR